MFTNESLHLLSRLPIDVLPHRSEATRAEEWQFQLWLGLHAVVVTTGKPLKIAPGVFDKTLELWRINLAESDQGEGSAEYKVNLEMAQWLEFCAHCHQDLLVPPT